MFPSGQGGMAFLQYAYQDQNRNWSGTSQGPAANNDDKEIQTDFVTFGLQYMFNWNWGLQVEVPYDFRYFKTLDDAGNVVSRNWSQLGDARIEGIYTGFSPEMSAGITFGVKVILLTPTWLTATHKSAQAARIFCWAASIVTI